MNVLLHLSYRKSSGLFMRGSLSRLRICSSDFPDISRMVATTLETLVSEFKSSRSSSLQLFVASIYPIKFIYLILVSPSCRGIIGGSSCSIFLYLELSFETTLCTDVGLIPFEKVIQYIGSSATLIYLNLFSQCPVSLLWVCANIS